MTFCQAVSTDILHFLREFSCAWRIQNSLAFLGFRQLVTMGAMRDLAVLFLHLLATVARLAGPGGTRAVVAESVLVKQQLLILNRSRKRSPNLRLADGFGSTARWSGLSFQRIVNAILMV